MFQTFDKVPTEIQVNRDKDRLTVNFDDGASFTFTAEFLRVTSPSAEVQGHAPHERKTVPGKKNVRITQVEPVGNYAIKIAFDDGHDTGIYSWKHLYETGQNQDAIWQQYLNELAEKGLSR